MSKDNQSICKIDQCGNKWWYVNEQCHREDGPAIELTIGSKFWVIHNKYHRLDGPAAEHANGEKSWYYHGEKINVSSQEEFERLIKLKILW